MEKSKDSIKEEALEAMDGIHRCSIMISVGVGKTYTALTDMARIFKPGDKFLVVAPKKSIHATWLDELDKFHLSFLRDAIVFSTYLSLHKQKTDYKKVYLDEVHSVTDKNEGYLASYKGPVLGLSGTNPLNFTEKGKIIEKFCPVVYTYITDDAVDDKILNDYKIFIHYIKLGTAKDIPNKTKTGKIFFTSEQNSYDYWTSRLDRSYGKELEICRLMRMKAMQKFKSKEVYVKQLMKTITEKCIIFANETLQADLLCRYSYHSKNANSELNLELFKSGKIPFLSAVNQLSEGVNITGLKELVVMHSFSNPRSFKQKLGRGLRLNVDDIVTVHLLVYQDTVDDQWKRNALAEFKQEKIFDYGK